MVERAIRYNIHTNTGEQERTRHRYTFVLVNSPREIGRIKERIFKKLEMIDEFRRIYYHPIPKSRGLYCEIFSLSTEVGEIRRKDEIYDNLKQFRQDRALEERDERDILPYVERL